LDILTSHSTPVAKATGTTFLHRNYRDVATWSRSRNLYSCFITESDHMTARSCAVQTRYRGCGRTVYVVLCCPVKVEVFGRAVETVIPNIANAQTFRIECDSEHTWMLERRRKEMPEMEMGMRDYEEDNVSPWMR
jgi:hypothetical protein